MESAALQADDDSVDDAFGPPTTVPPFMQRVLELAATDPQLQALMPREEVTVALLAEGQTAEQILTTVLDSYGPRPAVGERAYEVVPGLAGLGERSLLPRFDTISYTELRDRVRALALAWREHNEVRLAEGELFCTFGFCGTDYATVDLACILAHAVAVPLQTSLAGVDLDGIVDKLAPAMLAASIDDAVRAA